VGDFVLVCKALEIAPHKVLAACACTIAICIVATSKGSVVGCGTMGAMESVVILLVRPVMHE
jgi:hypothetical protein